MNAKQNATGRRALPSVSRLLESPEAVAALESLPRNLFVNALRGVLAEERNRLTENPALPDETEMLRRAMRKAEAALQPSLRNAVNATGIVLHTGLGRAVLAEAAAQAVLEAARAHSTLEIDLETGQRGSRQDHVCSLLRELTGAESALVVNNNAGATFLAVTALAQGKEVLISRGELIEIGGSFRMPDIIRASGATLVEVGTTNRTRLSDYAQAITERTGLILRCHPSNFKIVGFTEETAAAELVELGQNYGIPVMDDLGSGALVDTTPFGAATTTFSQAVQSGCDVITASGDKLLGGPQAGLILGKNAVLPQIARHPLARALRVDKLTLAALRATLQLYRDPETVMEKIPTLRYLARTKEQLSPLAMALADGLKRVTNGLFQIDVVEEFSQVGGGSLPGENLPTVCVRLKPDSGRWKAEECAARLRKNRPPIFCRIREEALLLDPRTLEAEEQGIILDAFNAICRNYRAEDNALKSLA